MASISRPREQAVTNDAAEQQQIDRIGNPAAAAIEIGGHHDGERSGRQHEVRSSRVRARPTARGRRTESTENRRRICRRASASCRCAAKDPAAPVSLRRSAHHGAGIHRGRCGQSCHGMERVGLQRYAAEPLWADLSAVHRTVVSAVYSGVRHLPHRRKAVPSGRVTSAVPQEVSTL